MCSRRIDRSDSGRSPLMIPDTSPSDSPLSRATRRTPRRRIASTISAVPARRVRPAARRPPPRRDRRPERSAPPSGWPPCRCARRPWPPRAAARVTPTIRVARRLRTSPRSAGGTAPDTRRRCAAGRPARSRPLLRSKQCAAAAAGSRSKGAATRGVSGSPKAEQQGPGRSTPAHPLGQSLTCKAVRKPKGRTCSR